MTPKPHRTCETPQCEYDLTGYHASRMYCGDCRRERNRQQALESRKNKYIKKDPYFECNFEDCETILERKSANHKYCDTCAIKSNRRSARQSKEKQKELKKVIDNFYKFPAPKPITKKINRACQYTIDYTNGQNVYCEKPINGGNYCEEHKIKSSKASGNYIYLNNSLVGSWI